jgi:hypothetical protein
MSRLNHGAHYFSILTLGARDEKKDDKTPISIPMQFTPVLPNALELAYREQRHGES